MIGYKIFMSTVESLNYFEMELEPRVVVQFINFLYNTIKEDTNITK